MLVCVCLVFTILLHAAQGPWQRQAAALADSSDHFSAFKPYPVPKYKESYREQWCGKSAKGERCSKCFMQGDCRRAQGGVCEKTASGLRLSQEAVCGKTAKGEDWMTSNC